MTMCESRRQTATKTFVWKTWPEIAELVGPDIATSIRQHCMGHPDLFRMNPNAPQDPNATQFRYVTDMAEVVDTTTASSTLSGGGQVSAAHAKALAAELQSFRPAIAGEPSSHGRAIAAEPSPPPQQSPSEPSPADDIIDAAPKTPSLVIDTSDPLQVKAQKAYQNLLKKQDADKKRADIRKQKVAADKAKRDAAREAEKKQKEATKLLSSSKAKVWASGLNKDIGTAQGYIVSVPQSTDVTEALRTTYHDKFTRWHSTLASLKQSMDTPGSEEDAQTLMASAPDTVKEFHKCVKNWKQIVKQKI